MQKFYQILANSFISILTVSLTWFALSLWVYVQTNSVFATSIMYGIYLIAITLTGMWFGSLVDHNKKKNIMLIANTITLVMFLIAFSIYVTTPQEVFTDYKSLTLWAFVVIIFAGVIVGNIRGIALPTLTTIMVPEEVRDKANGLSGTINGISFLLSSVASGFLLATSGMFYILLISIILTVIAIIHLIFIEIPEEKIQVVEEKKQKTKKWDILHTIDVVRKIPGLFALILFTTANNFLSGVFMPLLDPYGLSLVSLKTWGLIWGFLSTAFIFGGMFIAKFGLGKNPLQTMFKIMIAMWIISILFTIQPSIILLCTGMFIWISIMPFIEASEQTIIQKIVPKERQGRVFGFAQSVETAASPLTTFAIGPLAQFFFIPFMTTGAGVDLIGGWFGVGEGRGIALVFITAGIVGLVLTLFAIKTKYYSLLSEHYQRS